MQYLINVNGYIRADGEWEEAETVELILEILLLKTKCRMSGSQGRHRTHLATENWKGLTLLIHVGNISN